MKRYHGHGERRHFFLRHSQADKGFSWINLKMTRMMIKIQIQIQRIRIRIPHQCTMGQIKTGNRKMSTFYPSFFCNGICIIILVILRFIQLNPLSACEEGGCNKKFRINKYFQSFLHHIQHPTENLTLSHHRHHFHLSLWLKSESGK